jgi:hypothetical protein
LKRGEDGGGDGALDDERDETEASAAGARQGIDVVDALEQGRPIDSGGRGARRFDVAGS